MDETGADALRFALIHGATPGHDQRFGPQKLENARNFANKLWNAARFVLGARPAEIRPMRPAAPARRTPTSARPTLDPLAGGRHAEAVDRAHRRVPVRRGDPRPVRRHLVASSATGASSSPRSGSADETLPAAEREATWWTLVEALDTYLRLLHPVMPFVTEAIWGAAAAPRSPRSRTA